MDGLYAHYQAFLRTFLPSICFSSKGKRRSLRAQSAIACQHARASESIAASTTTHLTLLLSAFRLATPRDVSARCLI